MQPQTLFSVLVANYNNGKYLAECLDSILKQDYPNIEIVVIDDASIDNSLAIISPYLAQYHHIKLYQNSRNEGVGYTKKRCIDEAKGEILGFVDPDDTITPDAVRKMIEAHQAHQQAALIYSNYYECDEQLKVIREYKVKQVENGLRVFFNEDEYIGALCTFKKKSYEQTSGINPYLKNAEDQDLYFKLYDVGDAIYLNETLYNYRIHHGGISSLGNADKSYFWRWQVILSRAESKGIDMEEQFNQTFVRRTRIKHVLAIDNFIRKSFLYRWLRR